MRSIRVFIRNNFILKGIFLALSYVFPFTFWCYLTGFKNLDPTNFVWVGVYSCLLLCLSVRSMVIRAGMVSLNLCCFLMLLSILALEEQPTAVSVVLKAFCPFLAGLWA